MTELSGLNWLRADTLRYFDKDKEMGRLIESDNRRVLIRALLKREARAKQVDPVRKIHIVQFIARWRCFSKLTDRNTQGARGRGFG